MKTINPLAFKMLFDNATFLFHEDEDTPVSFIAEYSKWKITAYLENDITVEIEDFGDVGINGWNQCEPTKYQLQAIQSRMVIELDADTYCKTVH